MKKLLIGLTILFSFLFINNVSAVGLDNTNLFEHIHLTNLYGLTDEEMLELGNSVGVDLTTFIENYNIHKSKLTLTNFMFNNTKTIFYKDTDILTLNIKNYDTYYNIQIEDRNPTYKVSVKYNTSGTTNFYTPSQSSYVLGQILNIQKSTEKEYYLFYITDLEEDIYLKYTTGYSGSGFMTDNITIDNTIYSINEITSINLKTGYNSLIDKEPQLEYKTGFISSEAYSVLGKVTNNFTISDNKFLLEYRNYKFKLQFGSNDFTNENIPVFSHYKIFGLNRGTNNYENLDKYFNDSFFALDIIDTTYDYSEGMLADASITLQLNYDGNDEELEIFNTLYSQIKLEFYLDNTQNGYIYCYDNLSSSKWEDTSKFLEDYIYYYFPSNYKYAFITSNNNINEGKIYFPTNSINNELVKLQGQYYNLEKHNFSFPIVTNLYLNDDYYSYFDFYFKDTENILLLNRAVGSYIYESWYNTTFLEHWYESLFLDYISISEDTYFYVPIGYNVYFTNNTNITINTSNGNINIDIENSKNDYENNIYNDNITGNSFFDLFIKSFNFFITPINSLFSIISLFFSILPIGVQYMFYVSFGFIIALIIYKFVL